MTIFLVTYRIRKRWLAMCSRYILAWAGKGMDVWLEDCGSLLGSGLEKINEHYDRACSRGGSSSERVFEAVFLFRDVAGVGGDCDFRFPADGERSLVPSRGAAAVYSVDSWRGFRRVDCFFFIFQSTLVRVHKVSWHRSIGWFGVGLATVMVPLGVTTAIVMARFNIARLHQDERDTHAFLSIPFYDMIAFGVLIGLAIYWRTKPEMHRRLIFISTCGLMDAPFWAL